MNPIFSFPQRLFRPWITLLLLSSVLGGCGSFNWDQAFSPDPALGDRPTPQPSATAPTPPMGVASPSSPKPSSSPDNSPASTSSSNANTSANTSANSTANTSQDFSDLDQAPAPLQDALRAVAQLGILTPLPDPIAPTPSSATPSLTTPSPTSTVAFAPNQPVTRRQYARWLLAANNEIYRDRPPAQIRPATAGTPSTFKDVTATDPDFAAIQGLAEAGIIPSALSGAQEQINFNPNEPLLREDLLLWKVPLDVRGALPASNLEAVKEAWGFQDTSKISAPALRAVLADYQNGDQAVIRRVFGYTTLFQPKKSVTRAEAAASLAYFGSQGQGQLAADVGTAQLGVSATETKSPTPGPGRAGG